MGGKDLSQRAPSQACLLSLRVHSARRARQDDASARPDTVQARAIGRVNTELGALRLRGARPLHHAVLLSPLATCAHTATRAARALWAPLSLLCLCVVCV